MVTVIRNPVYLLQEGMEEDEMAGRLEKVVACTTGIWCNTIAIELEEDGGDVAGGQAGRGYQGLVIDGKKQFIS